MVLDQDNTFNHQQKEKKKKDFERQKQLQKYQRAQAGELDNTEIDDGNLSRVYAGSVANTVGKRAKKVGGPM